MVDVNEQYTRQLNNRACRFSSVNHLPFDLVPHTRDVYNNALEGAKSGPNRHPLSCQNIDRGIASSIHWLSSNHVTLFVGPFCTPIDPYVHYARIDKSFDHSFRIYLQPRSLTNQQKRIDLTNIPFLNVILVSVLSLTISAGHSRRYK